MPEIDKGITLDILDTNSPALSTTSDMPVVETRPDSSPEVLQEKIDAKAVPPESTAEKQEDAGEVEQTEEESATSETDEQSGHPAKVPRGVGKRLAELTKRADEERARAQAAEDRLNQALSALEKATSSVGLPKVDDADEPLRPTRTEYMDPEQWDQALLDYADKKATYAANKAVAAVQSAEAEKTRTDVVSRAQQELQEQYKARTEKVAARYSDYKEVAESPDVQVSMPMAVAILNSEQGPELQYYLGKNPAEAERISKYQTRDVNGQLIPDAPRQIMELGMLAAKLTAQPASPPITKAPKPIRPNAPRETSIDKDVNEMSMDEYAAMRKEQMRSSVRH